MKRMSAAAAIAVWCWSGSARAQSAATCAFDSATAAATVTVDGVRARLSVVATTGEIRLDGVACSGATVDNTDTVQVNGGPLADEIILSGRFAPGLTREIGEASEIEISFALGDGTDDVVVNGTNGNDRVTFTAGGIDVKNDLDEDLHLAGVERIEVHGMAGDDNVDASALTTGSRLQLYGGDGNDRLIDSSGDNDMFGQAGDDVLYGGAGNDGLFGGPGNDVMYGGDGDDDFAAEAAADGSDVISGGAGIDTVDYEHRTTGVTVTLGNGLADDGEAGEADEVRASVENAFGSAGDDVLVGTPKANQLRGMGGNDELYGGAGDDLLIGDAGDDTIFGDNGNDRIEGDGLFWAGNDILTGGPGSDDISGDAGDDIIFNGDGVADAVDCGDGANDDAEPDPLDTFVGCEL